jgi:leucyl-tRNA synthetase
MPADYYVCGSEHNTGHILYMRFWFIFLKEIGIIKDSTPVIKLINQGLILGPDGKKMSKSKGNTIDPMNVVETHGADALRLYAAFMGPYCATLP